ncbi:MAG: tRNA (cytidine(34)-2'-O)-methyltransferase [Myxococcota bacterium]
MLHVVLFQPDIPQNTGNVGRSCAMSYARLHLIHPLGFTITDRHLRRSGMDYWKSLDVHEHPSWEALVASPLAPQRYFLFSTQAERGLWDVEFRDEDGLVFGKETAGAPPWLHEWAGPERRVKIPQANPKLRSLNLSTAAGVALFEALRQTRHA